MININKLRIRLTHRKNLLIVCTAVFIIIAGIFYIYQSWLSANREMAQESLLLAETAEASIQKDGLSLLNINDSDVGTSYYEYLKEAMRRFVIVNKDVRFAYIYTAKDDKIYFVVDSEEVGSEGYSPPGQEYYEADEETWKPLREGVAFVSAPMEDRWGEWVSALVPVVGKNGEVVAVFGIDYSYKKWHGYVLGRVINATIIVIIVMLLFAAYVHIINRNSALTRRKEELLLANKRIRSEAEKFTKAFQSSAVLMAISDKKSGHYLDVNDMFVKTLGYSREEIIGKKVSALELFVHEEERTKAIRELEEKGSLFDYEAVVRTKDGTLRVGVFSAEKIEIDGLDCLFTTMMDVTKRKELERIELEKEAAEAAAALKSRFLANMSHEIKTPINGIMGFLQLLQTTNLDEEQEEFVNESIVSAESLIYLVNNILDFSKIEAGKVVIEKIEFNIRSTIEGIVSAMAVAADKKNIRLHSFISSNVPEIVIGDPTRIRQILNNFLSNALKFTLEGEINVNINAVAVKRGSSIYKIYFEVADTGIGISEDKMQTIFNPFTQEDNSISRRFGGTGLGLAISRELVDAMGGELGVNSVRGEGTTFFFTVAMEAVLEVSKTFAMTDKSFAELSVMIADNSVSNQRIIKNYLEEAGVEKVILLEKEDDIVESISKCADCIGKIDILILEKGRINDFDLFSSDLIKTNPVFQNVHLILLTSYSEKGDALKAKRKGFDAFLSTPLKKDELLNCISLVAALDGESIDANTIITKYTSKEHERSTSLKILVVENSELDIKVIVAMLGDLKLSCDIAKNGLEALEACKYKSYDVIFMDYLMPLMDGCEATMAIRNSNCNDSTVIIATTADMMKKNKELLLASGMDYYLNKPLDFKKVSAIIREITDSKNNQ